MEKKSGKKDQNSAPLTRSSSKKTIYIGPFSQKLGRHDFFLSSGTGMEYIMYRKISELDFTPV